LDEHKISERQREQRKKLLIKMEEEGLNDGHNKNGVVEEALLKEARTATEAMEQVNRFRSLIKPYTLPSFQYVRCG
jgi:hypothetical protein